MSDLIQQLRDVEEVGVYKSGSTVYSYPDVCREAADEIERLRAALSEIADGYGPHHLSKYARGKASTALKMSIDTDKPCGCIERYAAGTGIWYVPECECLRKDAAKAWCKQMNNMPPCEGDQE